MKTTRNGKQKPRDGVMHARTPSPSCLLFLFADRVVPVPVADPVALGQPVPRSAVGKGGTEEVLLAAAVWSLRERSMVRLDRLTAGVVMVELLVDVPKRPWYCPKRDHWRNLYDSGVMGDAGLLEHAVLVLVRGGRSNVSWIMRGALESVHPASRHDVPSSEAREEARYLGLLDRRSAPVGGALSRLEASFVETAEKWDAFRRSEAELFDDLMEACRIGRAMYADHLLL